MTEQEFRERVMPLRRMMYGIALKLGIPPDDAADAVQETQVKLWRHRAGIPLREGECRLYCLAAFRNECLTALRRQRPSASLDEVAEVRSENYNETEYRDTRRRIEILIDTLPKGQRDVIRMSGFGGLDNEEIAEATGLTENNIRQLLSRGRRKLREMLDKGILR